MKTNNNNNNANKEPGFYGLARVTGLPLKTNSNLWTGGTKTYAILDATYSNKPAIFKKDGYDSICFVTICLTTWNGSNLEEYMEDIALITAHETLGIIRLLRYLNTHERKNVQIVFREKVNSFKEVEEKGQQFVMADGWYRLNKIKKEASNGVQIDSDITPYAKLEESIPYFRFLMPGLAEKHGTTVIEHGRFIVPKKYTKRLLEYMNIKEYSDDLYMANKTLNTPTYELFELDTSLLKVPNNN